MIILSQDVRLSLMSWQFHLLVAIYHVVSSSFIISILILLLLSIYNLLRGINSLSVAELMICDRHNTQPRDSKS